jgi:phosphinothricin acetyltransferase
VFLVAVDAGSVVGFAYSGPFRARPAYAATRETSVYLAAGARGTGVGRALYSELLTRLDDAGVHTQVAVVALPNDASEALHRALGFERVGVLREVGRKFGRYIDTAWWQRMP